MQAPKKHKQKGSNGYKQNVYFVNEYPKILTKIKDVGSLVQTRYDPNLPKTSDRTTFLQRPIRYQFSIYFQMVNEEVPLTHSYIFDDYQTAKKAHIFCLKRYIDDTLEVYRNYVKNGFILTRAQMEFCEKIQALVPEEEDT